MRGASYAASLQSIIDTAELKARHIERLRHCVQENPEANFARPCTHLKVLFRNEAGVKMLDSAELNVCSSGAVQWAVQRKSNLEAAKW